MGAAVNIQGAGSANTFAAVVIKSNRLYSFSDKLVIQDYFDIMTIWFRDVLLYKATKEIDSLTFKDEIIEIKKQADNSSYQGLEDIIEGIAKAKTRLQANVSFELTLEMLLLTIQDA